MDRNAKESDRRKFINEKTLGDFFFNAATKFNDNIYQIDASIDEKESYGSVKQRSIRLAIQLTKRELKSSDVVILCTKNSLDNIIPIVASTFLGAKFATIDPTSSERQAKHLISLIEPKFIFVDKDSLGLIEESLENTKQKPEIVVFGSKYFTELLKPDEDEADFRPEDVDENDTAIIFFSSGTTVLPKAICHSHKSFINVIENSYGHFENDASTMLHVTTLYAISALIMVFGVFVEGNSRIFSREMSPEIFFKIVDKYRVTSAFSSPIFTKFLTTFKGAKKYDLSSLKSLLIGGTGISVEQLIDVQNFFEDAAICIIYAMTECGTISSLRTAVYGDDLRTKKRVSCGKINPEITLKIVDPDTEEKLGVNKSGEIRLCGNSFMTGYYKQSCEDVFDSEGFLKTGDIGYVDEDGFLYIEDRMKEMFKYKSRPIVPSAIEAVLYKHPAVFEAIVFGLPCDVETGEIPTACVVLNQGAQVSEDDIRKFVDERVSDIEKLRGGVIFVKQLQKTATGKFARKEIKDAIIKQHNQVQCGR